MTGRIETTAAGDGRFDYVAAAWALLRVMAALILLQHGLQKLFGLIPDPARPVPAADVFTRSWFAGMIECISGPLLLLGLFTRPAAFVSSGLMAFAYFLVHAPRGFFPVLNRGEPPVLLCFIFLFFAAAGAGPYSLDAWLRNRRRAVSEAGRDPAFAGR